MLESIYSLGKRRDKFEVYCNETKLISLFYLLVQMRISVPFSSYSILPAQSVVRGNVRIGHVRIILSISVGWSALFFLFLKVKEDIESLVQPLVPLLHICKPDIPKPRCLHWSIIEKLGMKVCSLISIESSLNKDYSSREFCNCCNFSATSPTETAIIYCSRPSQPPNERNVPKLLANFVNFTMNLRKLKTKLFRCWNIASV